MNPGSRCNSTFWATANLLLLCFRGVLAIGSESLIPGGTFIWSLASGPALGGVCIPPNPGDLGECETGPPPPGADAVPLPSGVAFRSGAVVDSESGWALRPFVGVAFCKRSQTTSGRVGLGREGKEARKRTSAPLTIPDPGLPYVDEEPDADEPGGVGPDPAALLEPVDADDDLPKKLLPIPLPLDFSLPSPAPPVPPAAPAGEEDDRSVWEALGEEAGDLPDPRELKKEADRVEGDVGDSLRSFSLSLSLRDSCQQSPSQLIALEEVFVEPW